MVDYGVTILCALVGGAFWTVLGYPIARKLGLQPALTMAPALGWGVHSGVSNVVFRLTGFTVAPVALISLGLLGLAAYATKQKESRSPTGKADLWIVALAAIVAFIPTLSSIPRTTPEGVILAAPIYDHAKIAIIDEIARGHLPPLNPFFFEQGLSDKLAYYWGWYASAAQLSLLFGVTGWEADISLSWFTALSSLLLMMSIAIWLGGRRSGAVFVALLSMTANLRPFIRNAFGSDVSGGLLSPEVGFGTWILNMPWVPQHMAGAVCAILSILLIPRLKTWQSVATLALLAAAGVGSSAYIGVFTFPLAATSAGLLVIIKEGDKRGFAVKVLSTSVLAAALSLPIVLDQAQAVAVRATPSIAFEVFEPLGHYVSEPLRSWLNPVAYWFLVFTVEWPALYIPGLIAAVYALRNGQLTQERRVDILLLAVLVIAALTVTFLVRSLIGNNDLGWRAVMPGFLVLTSLTAAGLANWFKGRAMAVVTLVVIGLALPHSAEFIRRLVEAYPSRSAAEFAKSRSLWDAVRRHTGPEDRVINNPLYLYDVTPWPTNISWALLSNRRSCYAVWEMVVVYSPLSNQESFDAAQVYNRIFAGVPAADDLQKIAQRYGCDVAILTPADAAWNRDPFANSPFYVVAEATTEWKIYVRRT